MNEITSSLEIGLPIPVQTLVLAQNPVSGLTDPVLNWINSGPGEVVVNLVTAIAILIVGWIIAVIAASITKTALSKTGLDNRLSSWVTGQSQSAQSFPIEKWAAATVFWVVMIFVLVAFLNALQLEAVSAPLNGFLEKIFAYLPQLGAAIVWLVGGWLIATVAKLILTRGLQTFRLDDQLNAAVGATAEDSPFLVNETLGNALYWFILLFAFYFALGTLGLQQQLQPLEKLLQDVLSALPRILTALLIIGAGWLVARVARNFITNLLATTGIDQLGARTGLASGEGQQTPSWIVGTLVYTIVLILVGIAALEELDIKGISDPAKSMLQQTFDTLPQIFAAVLVLIVSYFVGKFIGDLVTTLLTGVGFNNVLNWMGLAAAAPSSTPVDQVGQPAPQTRTASEIAGIVVLVGIMLMAVLFAVNILQFDQLTVLVGGLLSILGRTLVGVLVFGIGLYLANLVFNLVSSSGGGQARVLAQTARIVIIAFVVAMALQQIGIATNIVNLAFGLTLGALAVAFAIAFGLGGRDIAAEQIRQWLEAFKRNQ